jgi:hypothetical protein
MKLYLFCEESTDGLSPNCSSDIVNKDGVSPLACLLTDDGGQRFLDSLGWLDEGVDRINLVKNSSVDFADWSRDVRGVELTKEQAKIYPLYDEDYFEVLELDSFSMALLAWRKFIQMNPEVGIIQTIEI